MSENQGKLRLKNTDTNRFKVDTNATQIPPAPPAGPVLNAPPAQKPGATQAVVDPISLRDTATGRLRRISGNQSGSASVAPNAMASGAEKQGAVPLVVKPAAATGSEPVVSSVPPLAASPSSPKPSSTIKLNLHRVGGAPAAAPAAAPTAATIPAPVPAPAPAPVTPVQSNAPIEPVVGTNTLKIRPTTGAAPKPMGNAGATVKLKAPSSAGNGTVQVPPPAAPAPTVVPQEGKSSLRLKKEESSNSAKTQSVPLPPGIGAAPAPAAAAAAAAPASKASPAPVPAASAPKSGAASAPAPAPVPKSVSMPVNDGAVEAKPSMLVAVSQIVAFVGAAAGLVFSILSFTGYLN